MVSFFVIFICHFLSFLSPLSLSLHIITGSKKSPTPYKKPTIIAQFNFKFRIPSSIPQKPLDSRERTEHITNQPTPQIRDSEILRFRYHHITWLRGCKGLKARSGDRGLRVWFGTTSFYRGRWTKWRPKSSRKQLSRLRLQNLVLRPPPWSAADPTADGGIGRSRFHHKPRTHPPLRSQAVASAAPSANQSPRQRVDPDRISEGHRNWICT